MLDAILFCGPGIPPLCLPIAPAQCHQLAEPPLPSITQLLESDFPSPYKELPTVAWPDVPISWNPVIAESVSHEV